MSAILPVDPTAPTTGPPVLTSSSSSSKLEVVWPSQAVRDFRRQCNERPSRASSKLNRESSHIVDAKARSLLNVSKLTVKISDVEAGFSDIAELRSDGSGSFYSNFTSQHWELPRCLDKYNILHRFWSFCAFMASALHQLLFNFEAMLMAISGGASTFVCSENVLDFRATYQTSAIFIGLIFPLVFLIGQTFLRREKALERLASIKANGVQLVLKLITHGEPDGASRAVRVVECVRSVIQEIGKYLPQDSSNSGLRVSSIYGRFAELQADKECAMLSRFMLVEFEKLRAQRDYRTPWKLNYFCFMFGSMSPILCGPLFASMGCRDRFPARTPADGDSCGYGTPGAYLSAFFFALVLSSLLSIVKAMEDPFSLSGPDDVIASFTFEANALLHLIDQGMPGALKEGFRSLDEDWASAQRDHVKSLPAGQKTREHDAMMQGAVDGDSDEETIAVLG